ncbi:major histocompatibility complex class I-related gene protein-like [Engraulis encrasicolus]|uniref:major histocompatibility complex class I-related gene protein-like n=1 Tax=Engraulis encrasicolus TaxID=184585 RepID=UPI002FD42166
MCCICSLYFTLGIQSLQTIFGCDMLDHNTPGRMIYNESFNGHSGDQVYFSINDKAFETLYRWIPFVNKQLAMVVSDIYQPICLSGLHEMLKIHRNNVMRKVKPRVRLLQKALPDTGGVRVTCLATGFYPRHINLTLLRDGQPVAEQQISGGELLPNGDGSYQMRKSLEVSTEELQHHQYTCTAQHLSLDNKIDIPLGEEEDDEDDDEF